MLAALSRCQAHVTNRGLFQQLLTNCSSPVALTPARLWLAASGAKAYINLRTERDMAERQDENSASADAKEIERQIEHREKLLDEALKESFPASDPPSMARPHRSGER
jgi:hypothetical protein